MHKVKLIKRGGKTTPKYQFGGLSPELLKGIAGLTSKIGATTKTPGLNQDYTQANAGANTATNPAKAGMGINQLVGGGLQGLLSGVAGIQGLNNSGLNQDQKRMMTADTVVDTVSQIGSMIPGVGGIVAGALGGLNKLGGMLLGTPKAIKNFKVNDEVAGSTGYGGVAAGAGEVARSADSYKNAGFFGKLFGGKNKIIDKTNIANQQAQVVSRVLGQNRLAKDQMLSSDLNNQRNLNKLYGGSSWTNGSLQYGKKGMKIQKAGDGTTIAAITNYASSGTTKSYEQYKKLLSAAAKLDFKKIRMPKKYSDIPKDIKKNAFNSTVSAFAEGGVIEAPQNVIVDGALHAHLHDLKSVEELQDANITLKGVPVISQAEGGEITQHAEVERDELILHYECSKKLEELYEEGDEESMIEAGKLLTEELIKNTKDSSNGILENA